MQGSLNLQGECPMIARDIMTRNVHTIHPGARAQEAAHLLSQEHISGAPVVEANGKVIGIVTEADIISKVNREGLYVADIMSHEVIAVGEETTVSEIPRLFAEHNINRGSACHSGNL